LKVGSPIFVLEFSKPTIFPVKQLYWLYSKVILPLFGRLISNDKRAYVYLPESINDFPYGKTLIDIFKNCGYENCNYKPLTFQIATIYIGYKKNDI
jgi:demethylmenaquinone methyltransferase / 2-methoxy-6-polyprenyl-1,4-benzoquinol methylase